MRARYAVPAGLTALGAMVLGGIGMAQLGRRLHGIATVLTEFEYHLGVINGEMHSRKALAAHAEPTRFRYRCHLGQEVTGRPGEPWLNGRFNATDEPGTVAAVVTGNRATLAALRKRLGSLNLVKIEALQSSDGTKLTFTINYN